MEPHHISVLVAFLGKFGEPRLAGFVFTNADQKALPVGIAHYDSVVWELSHVLGPGILEYFPTGPIAI